MLGDLESINYSKDGYSCVELIDRKVFSIIYASIGFNVLFTSAIYEYDIKYIASASKEYYKDMIQMLIDFLKLCKFRNETNCLILHYYISFKSEDDDTINIFKNIGFKEFDINIYKLFVC
jgi:hypothetical protein